MNCGFRIADCGLGKRATISNPQSAIGNPQSTEVLRIIAGEFKGRRLKAPSGRTVRPTGDRVKEAWFSILQQSIPDARVLDLFAGSGALGFEALSRGAVSVDFVETHRASLAALKANAEALRVEGRVTIHRGDALRF